MIKQCAFGSFFCEARASLPKELVQQIHNVPYRCYNIDYNDRAVPRENQHCGHGVQYRPGSAKICHTDTFNLLWILRFSSHYSIPMRRNVSARISLRSVCRLISVDTLRRGHYCFFLFDGTAHVFANRLFSLCAQ